jgi:hypothetical protein
LILPRTDVLSPSQEKKQVSLIPLDKASAIVMLGQTKDRDNIVSKRCWGSNKKPHEKEGIEMKIRKVKKSQKGLCKCKNSC